MHLARRSVDVCGAVESTEFHINFRAVRWFEPDELSSSSIAFHDYIAVFVCSFALPIVHGSPSIHVEEVHV